MEVGTSQRMGKIPGELREIPPLGIGSMQESLVCWLAEVLIYILFESS